MLGIENNDFEIPDFHGIEIKTKRDFSKSFTSLFTMTPSGKFFHEVERIKDGYGYPDSVLKEYNVLNNSIFCGIRTWIGAKFQFMLSINRIERKVVLLVFDSSEKLIDDSVYWDFDVLYEKLYRKMSVVAFVSARRKIIDGIECFKYYKMEIFYLKNFDTFLELISNGTIRVSFRLCVFRSGIRKGKIHDHGTGFELKKEDFEKLFIKYKTIY